MIRPLILVSANSLKLTLSFLNAAVYSRLAGRGTSLSLPSHDGLVNLLRFADQSTATVVKLRTTRNPVEQDSLVP